MLDTSIGRITDFDPSEDMLVIEVVKDAETADRESTVVFEQTEENGVFSTQITLTFAETASASGATAAISIQSTKPFTMDDIALIES